jgi:glycerophosphoryl diester phosphodiesterase
LAWCAFVHAKALGVDGIITDYPDRLREVIAEKKMALP